MAAAQPPSLNQRSEQLLLAVKMQQPTERAVAELAAQPFSALLEELRSDAQKLAFWINCYNAYYQILRAQTDAVKPGIYREELITLAGARWSLDDMEHGILRRFRHKYALGYLPDPCVKRVVKQLAVDRVDWRIHFALNCGAKSCPPIAFYTPEGLDEQLDMATLSFLQGHTEVSREEKEIRVTSLFKWFRSDFGGTAGVRRILCERLGLETEGYRLVYEAYSWEDDLANFAE